VPETETASLSYGEETWIEKIGVGDHDFGFALTYLLPQLSSSAIVPDTEALKTILSDQNTSIFAAKLNNASHQPLGSPPVGDSKIIGIITVCYLNLLTGKIALIEDVVVDDSARNRGVGKALVSAAITECLSKNVKHVELTSRPQRAAANKLYEQMGFARRETNVWRYVNDSYTKL
jgi:ribosomal protein S18 acetylase RimI-like enzyme